MAPPKKPTPAQARERRSKIAAVVLGVAFLGVTAVQGPKLLKALHSGSSAPEAAAAQTSATQSSTAPAGSASTATLASATLATGQLTSFATLPPKDPFKALVSATDSSTGASGATGNAATAGSQTPAVVTPAAGASGATFTETPATPPAAARPTVPAALIVFNGRNQVVALGAGFPKKHPVFRLVSLALNTVEIKLIGGSFANGKTTLVLTRHAKTVLSDSTSGGRFVLTLVKLTTTTPPKASTATTTPATTIAAGASGAG
jgi:hypothetical protein